MTEIDPCPLCGALPCDWVDNPHVAEASQTIKSLTARAEAAEAEVQRLTYNGIHTCHAECPRLPCVQRREIEALTKALIDGAGELEGFVCYFDDMVKVSEMAKWRGWAGQEPKPEWTPYDQAAATIAALRAEVERLGQERDARDIALVRAGIEASAAECGTPQTDHNEHCGCADCILSEVQRDIRAISAEAIAKGEGA